MSPQCGVIQTRRLTYGFLTRAKPYHMRGVRDIRPAAQNRQNTTKTLRTWLRDAKDVQVSFPRCSKVGCPVNVELEIECTTCTFAGRSGRDVMRRIYG